jgi:hypothetical protein
LGLALLHPHHPLLGMGMMAEMTLLLDLAVASSCLVAV